MASTPTDSTGQTRNVQPQKVQWYNTFVPILLILLTLLVSVSFQGVMLVKDHEALQTTKANQDTALDESNKLRTQLDSIATQTARLAAAGNVNANLIIEKLKANGIMVKATKTSNN